MLWESFWKVIIPLNTNWNKNVVSKNKKYGLFDLFAWFRLTRRVLNSKLSRFQMEIVELAFLLSSIVAAAALIFACGFGIGLRQSIKIPSKTEFWRLEGSDIKWHEKSCKKLEKRTDLVRAFLCSECEVVLEHEFCKLCYKKKQKWEERVDLSRLISFDDKNFSLRCISTDGFKTFFRHLRDMFR